MTPTVPTDLNTQTAKELASQLADSMPARLNLVVVDAIDSTNRWARAIQQRVEKKATLPPTVIVALHQTRGSGRNGRRWSSGRGMGVWASWLGSLPSDRLPSLPLRVGVALCTVMERMGVVGVGLKWPNDVVYRQRKLAGILCRSSLRNEAGLAICGFGLNFKRPEGEYASIAVGLEELLDPVDPVSVIADCLAEVDRFLRGEDLDSDWQSQRDRYSVHRVGDRILWHDGDRVVTGRFAGYNHHGHLRLLESGEERTYAVGEID